jgi:hypothetical protein
MTCFVNTPAVQQGTRLAFLANFLPTPIVNPWVYNLHHLIEPLTTYDKVEASRELYQRLQ